MPIKVTEVLDYFKEPWYIDWVCRVGKREANKVSRQAMKIGTRVDELIKRNPYSPDEFLRPKKEQQEVINCIGAYLKWFDIYKPKSIVPCKRETMTIEHEITGEPDLLVDDVLVDIKCASKISLKYWIQVNMYVMLRGFTTKVGILRLDKETTSYEYVVKDYDKNLVTVWLGLMRAYVYLKGDDNGGLDLQEVGENKEVA